MHIKKRHSNSIFNPRNKNWQFYKNYKIIKHIRKRIYKYFHRLNKLTKLCVKLIVCFIFIIDEKS